MASDDLDDVLALSLDAVADLHERGEVTAAVPLRLRDQDMGPPDHHRTISLWEEKWPRDRLIRRWRELTAREFDRSYRQYAISEEDQLWKADWLHSAVDSSFVAPVTIANTPWAECRRFGGVDLAIADAKDEGAFFAISVIAVDANRHTWLLRHERHRGLTFGQQFRLIRDVYQDLLWDNCGVESNAYQKAIIHHLQEDGLVPVTKVNTGATEKRVGIPLLAAEFEQARWHLPGGDARSRAMIAPLLEEMDAYPSPSAPTDGIMSLFFAREVFRSVNVGAPKIVFIR